MVLTKLFVANRIRMSQLFVLLIMVLLAVSESRWERTFMDAVLFLFGAVLVGAATMGRLWCSLYIAGYKEGTLITIGPYSISRNPLYFFSFVGAVGLGLATETFTFGVLFALWFALFYPAVIRGEEQRLREVHGARFAALPCHARHQPLLRAAEVRRGVAHRATLQRSGATLC